MALGKFCLVMVLLNVVVENKNKVDHQEHENLHIVGSICKVVELAGGLPSLGYTDTKPAINPNCFQEIPKKKYIYILVLELLLS